MAERNRYSIDEFSGDVRRILDAQGETTEAVWALGPLLQRLARELEPLGDPGLRGPQRAALHRPRAALPAAAAEVRAGARHAGA